MQDCMNIARDKTINIKIPLCSTKITFRNVNDIAINYDKRI